MGAEEYELLVSTLNKLPILKETLKKETEDLKSSRQMKNNKKKEVRAIKAELSSRDSKIKEIETSIEAKNSYIEKLEQETTDLVDLVKIEEEKLEPYSQRLIRAEKSLKKAKESWWNDEKNRLLTYIVANSLLMIYVGESDEEYLGMAFLGSLLIPMFLMLIYSSNLRNMDFYTTTNALNHREYVKNELEKARLDVLGDLEAEISGKKRLKRNILLENKNLQREIGALMGIDEKLKKRNESLGVWEKRVDGLVQKVESLEKEIEEGQNAIAPLIPYSNLLLDGSEE